MRARPTERLRSISRDETDREAQVRRGRERAAHVAAAGPCDPITDEAARREPVTARIQKPPDSPKYKPEHGGCADCGHLRGMHSSGYNERSAPCKAAGCRCAKHRVSVTWRTYATAVFVVLAAAGITAVVITLIYIGAAVLAVWP